MKDFTKYDYKSSDRLFRKKSIDARRSSLKLALTWVVMILVALFFVQQRISYIRMEKKVLQLMREKDRIQLSILPLMLEERFLTRLNRVEKTAKEELYLQFPRKSQTINVFVEPGSDLVSGNDQLDSETRTTR